MRLIVALAALICAASIVLALLAAVHLPFHKHTTSDAVAFIDQRFIDRSKLSIQDTKLLERHWSIILGNDGYITAIHIKLWQTAVFGFAGLSVASLVLAVLCVHQLRSRRRLLPPAAQAA